VNAGISARAWRPVGAAMFACGWGGNQFTPLLVMYRDAGYSVLTVDTLLGAYVIGLVPGLLLSGGLSDRFGRRPVMLAGSVLSLLASALLALGERGPGWLAAGRFITGVAVAVAMAVGSTWVKELSDLEPDPAADRGTGRAALCLTLGLGVGPGVAGVLAQWGPMPMVLPYLVHVLLVLAVLPLVRRSPETVPLVRRGSGGVRVLRRSPGNVRLAGVDREDRPGRLGVVRHPRFRRVIVPMAPWVFGSAGVAYAIMPQLVGDRVGHWGLAYSTLLTVCTLAAGTVVQPLARRLDRTTSARGVVVGMVVMSVGLAASAVAAALRSPLCALVAAVVLGGAYGIAVLSGLLELQRLAPPEELAGLIGVYYALAYLGFLVPSLLAVLSVVVSYPVLLVGLAAVAFGGTLLIVRHSRAHLPLLVEPVAP
jgi:MFS family permease